MLKKAGMSNLKVDLSASDAAFNGAVDAGVLYQQHAKAAGIDINIVREPNDGYWDNVWLKKPWCADYWSGRPTATGCSPSFTPRARPGTRPSGPIRVQRALGHARAETEDQEARRHVCRIQQFVHNDGGAMVLVFNNYVDAHSKKLAHEDIAPNWEVDGLRIA